MSRRRTGVVLLLMSFAVTALAGIAWSEVWDLTSDFSTDNGNPNGVWTYGWARPDFSTFALLDTVWDDGTSSGWTLPEWQAVMGGGVWKNLGAPAWDVPTGWVSLHPGPGYEPSIIRWTAPAGVNGPARIAGEFLPGHSGIMQVAIRRNDSEIWSAVDAGSFDLSAAVAPGDTIDFAVYGGYWSGNTPLTATIETPKTWFEDDDPAISYHGTWVQYPHPEASAGHAVYSVEAGASAEFSFVGTGITCHVWKGPMMGKVRVWLDGAGPLTMDLYAPTLTPSTLSRLGLAPGPHTAVTEVARQKRRASSGYVVDFDALEVVP